MEIKYYLSSSGRSPVEDFLEVQSEDIRSDFVGALELLSQGKVLKMPLSRSLASIHRGLHELRLKDAKGQVRVLYFIKKREAIYLLHAFKKKSQAIPAKELKLVLKRIKEV